MINVMERSVAMLYCKTYFVLLQIHAALHLRCILYVVHFSLGSYVTLFYTYLCGTFFITKKTYRSYGN